MINDALISQVKTFSVAERIGLIEVVWEILSSSEVPVSNEEKVMLDTRLTDMERNPEDQNLLV